MTERDIIKTIINIEKDCKKEGNQKDNQINYEIFYHRVMGMIELADEATRPKSGGIAM